MQGAYGFLEASRPDRVDVQVFNPDVDNEGWYAPVTVIRTNITERPFVVDTIRDAEEQGYAGPKEGGGTERGRKDERAGPTEVTG